MTTVYFFLQTSVIFFVTIQSFFGYFNFKYHLLESQPPIEHKAIKMSPKRLKPLYGEENKVVFHGSTQTKKIAITFDDGPDLKYTNQILDILKDHHVSATFFVMGKLSKKYPWVLKRMVREGHTIGNHSWSHKDFTKLSKDKIFDQLEKTNQLIYRLTGKKPQFFRPPFGAMNEKVIRYVSQKGYSIIYWNVDTRDWQGKTADEMMKVVKKNIRSGSIILFHSAGGDRQLDGTIQVLPRLISFLKKKGYEIVTIDQLIGEPAYLN